MDASQVQDAITNAGYRVPSTAELQSATEQKQYGTPSEQLKTFAEGMGSGATFGVSRHIANMTGLSTPQAQAARARVNPIASATGELGGVAGSLLIPGGVMVKGVGEVGQAVSRGVLPAAETAAKILANPETSPIMHSVLSKAISSGAGSAVEGAAYGLGQGISESAMGDPSAMKTPCAGVQAKDRKKWGSGKKRAWDRQTCTAVRSAKE